MGISAETFVNNAATYLDIFHLWLAWKGAPAFVQSAIAILEKAVEFPITANVLISALKNVPGFEGKSEMSVPEELKGLEVDLFEVSRNLIIRED